MRSTIQFHPLPAPSMPPVSTTSTYALIVTTSSMPAATVGVPYSVTLTASGGVPPYYWSLISGALPDGLTMDQFGNITGTPTTQGVFNFSVMATDPIGNMAVLNVGVAI